MDWDDTFDDMVQPRQAWGLVVFIFGALAFWVGVGVGIGYLIWADSWMTSS